MGQKGFFPLLLLCIVGIILACGGTYIVFNRRAQAVPPSSPSPEPVIQAPSPSPDNQIEGWKTYTNTQYGFTLNYPEDWTVSESQNPSDPEVYSIYFDHPDDIEPQDAHPNISIDIANLGHFDVDTGDTESTTIDGINASRKSESSGMQAAFKQVQFEKNSRDYRITLLYHDEREGTNSNKYDTDAISIFNQLTSSIKFN